MSNMNEAILLNYEYRENKRGVLFLDLFKPFHSDKVVFLTFLGAGNKIENLN